MKFSPSTNVSQKKVWLDNALQQQACTAHSNNSGCSLLAREHEATDMTDTLWQWLPSIPRRFSIIILDMALSAYSKKAYCTLILSSFP